MASIFLNYKSLWHVRGRRSQEGFTVYSLPEENPTLLALWTFEQTGPIGTNQSGNRSKLGWEHYSCRSQTESEDATFIRSTISSLAERAAYPPDHLSNESTALPPPQNLLTRGVPFHPKTSSPEKLVSEPPAHLHLTTDILLGAEH